MSLPSDLKYLYIEWLQEIIDTFGSHQEQLQITYDRAKKSLIESEGPFFYPSELKKVKGIGEAITKKLENKLKDYCFKNNFAVPNGASDKSDSGKRTTTLLRSTSLDSNLQLQPAKKRRKYIPKKRSGGYAILLGLLESGTNERGITKEIVVQIAQKYCNHSMLPNYATKEMHGAWSSISSLRNNSLILEEGRPRRYTLTAEGIELAKTLKEADGIVFESEEITSSLNENRYWNDPDEVTANLSSLFEDKSFSERVPGEIDSSIMNVTFNDDTNLLHRPNSRFNTIETSNPISRKIDTLSNGDQFNSITQRRFQQTSYQLWKKGSFDIFPIIDHREVKSVSDREFFLNALSRKNVYSELRQLALGDILWVARHKTSKTLCVLDTIIERKRLDDLAGSIRDNRFMEQKTRLEKSGCKNKIYLIEETIGVNNNNIQLNMEEALKTALWLILVYYKFSMIRTSNSEETVDKLSNLNEVITKYYKEKELIVIYPDDITSQESFTDKLQLFKKEFERNKSIECCHTFECFQDIMGKGDSRTIGELTINILMYIKGVSLEKAIAIQNIYPTLNHILKAYKKCKTPNEAELLLFVKLGDAPGAKKITKSLSEKIADVFYDN